MSGKDSGLELPMPRNALVPKAQMGADGPRYSRLLEEARYSAHTLVGELVGSGHRVLDLGSGEGALAASLSLQGNTVVAVERTPSLAAEAARRGLTVVTRDLEKEGLEDLGRFGVIVCADVLEHLVDPSRVLTRLAALLEPGGSLVCSIPNVAHYSIRLKVLRGDFEYEETGILDRTHLHFYTRRSARQLFESAGLRVTDERISLGLNLGFAPLNRLMERLFRSTRVADGFYKLFSTFPGIFAFQFVFRAQPPAG